MNETNPVRVLIHSAIRIAGEKTLYFDPFHLSEEPKDGDIVLITHEHYDHLSPDDIARAAKPGAWIILPKSCRTAALKAGLRADSLLFMDPGEEALVEGVKIEAVPAYNVGKLFHPKAKKWLGYVVTLDGVRYYVAGDTDDNEDVRKVQCDVALLPVGGTYTMTAPEAAALANVLMPKLAIPTHYGDIVGDGEASKEFAARLNKQIACSFAK